MGLEFFAGLVAFALGKAEIIKEVEMTRASRKEWPICSPLGSSESESALEGGVL
jgi:hypothetical protein